MSPHITEHLLAYVENRLEPEQRARVDSHLGECEQCRGKVAATQELVGALAEAGRLVQQLPVNTLSGWVAVRQRWQTPISAQVRSVSRQLSWQVSFSLALVAMACVSGVSLTAVQAASPNVPSIETPGTRVTFTGDTPTLSVTESNAASQTPTLTLTPIPVVTS